MVQKEEGAGVKHPANVIDQVNEDVVSFLKWLHPKGN